MPKQNRGGINYSLLTMRLTNTSRKPHLKATCTTVSRQNMVYGLRERMDG